MEFVRYKSDELEEANCGPIYAWKFQQRCKEDVMSNLPTEANKMRKPGFPKGRTWLFYGPPKIGKSSIASQFPKSITFDLEDGLEDIGGMTFQNKPEGDEADPKLSARRLDWVAECLAEMEGPGGKKYETIVVDTLDMIHDWMEKDTLAFLSKKFKMELGSMGEAPNGADWAEARKGTLGILTALRQFARRTDKNVVIIAHSQSVMSEKGTTTEKAKTIDFPGKLGRRIPAQVDVIGYCFGLKGLDPVTHKSTINRFVSFQPYEELEAGCRYKELNGKVLPMTFKAIDDAFKGIVSK